MGLPVWELLSSRANVEERVFSGGALHYLEQEPRFLRKRRLARG